MNNDFSAMLAKLEELKTSLVLENEAAKTSLGELKLKVRQQDRRLEKIEQALGIEEKVKSIKKAMNGGDR